MGFTDFQPWTGRKIRQGDRLCLDWDGFDELEFGRWGAWYSCLTILFYVLFSFLSHFLRMGRCILLYDMYITTNMLQTIPIDPTQDDLDIPLRYLPPYHVYGIFPERGESLGLWGNLGRIRARP